MFPNLFVKLHIRYVNTALLFFVVKINVIQNLTFLAKQLI